ncbi:MAG: hypothetical protein AAGA42_01950 [Actinomycetota bacterium]
MATLLEEFANAERANPGFVERMLGATTNDERIAVLDQYDLGHLRAHPDVGRLRELGEQRGVPHTELHLDEDEIQRIFSIDSLDDIEHPALREMFSSASLSNMITCYNL